MRGIRSSKEPLVYVIPSWLQAADESNEELRHWMSGDPRNWLYADWTLNLGHHLPLSRARCQKELCEIWVPAGYGLRWTQPRADSFSEGLLMEIMPEKLCVDPYAKKGTHSWTQFFQFTGLEALMERKHMFKVGADEGCYGIASGEENESEVEYDSDDSDTPILESSC